LKFGISKNSPTPVAEMNLAQKVTAALRLRTGATGIHRDEEKTIVLTNFHRFQKKKESNKAVNEGQPGIQDLA